MQSNIAKSESKPNHYMKNHLSLSSLVAVMGAALAFQMDVAGAQFNPVQLTPSSYTFSIVVPSNYVAAVPYCVNAFIGSGFCLSCDTTYYEEGMYTRPGSPGYNSGVPLHNSVFTNINNTNMTFLMPPDYTTSNDLMIVSSGQYGTITSGTFTFNPATTATSLAILDTGGNGGALVGYVVTHADNSTDTGQIQVPDWYNGGSTVAWGANGRMDENGNYSSFTSSDVNNSAPYLYAKTITVSSNSPVSSITFNYVSGGGVDNFFAVSASIDNTTYKPVVVTGFNVISIIPATTPFPVTATMDNGTNIDSPGNTWFEQGYYTNTAYGLAPSGSKFSSYSQPTHFYQMGSYSGNNAILIDTNHLSANITPAAPAPAYGYAFVTAGGHIGGGNKMTNVCILQHQDGVNETNLFYGYDWFEQSVPGAIAFEANGRVDLDNRTLNNLGNGGLPYMFETYFLLNDNTSPVTNIVVGYKTAPSASATTFIMAVSAATNPIAPLITQEALPKYQAWFASQSATISVLASGTAPITNIWLVESNGVYVPLKDGVDANGSIISGSATTTLTISDLKAGDGTNYEYTAENAAGSQTSTPAYIDIKGKTGVVPISVWNNIANQTYPFGNSTNITSGDGLASATLTLSGAGVNNAWNSGLTGDGGNQSLMHGYIDAGNYGGFSATAAFTGLTNTLYNVYLYCFPDQTRPDNSGDYLPNYTVNGTTYYAPLLGATGSSGFDTGGTSVGGTGFNGFIEATTTNANNNTEPVAGYFGNYIEIANVSPTSGEIDIEAEPDTTTYRSPLNGIELVPATGSGEKFGVHFLGNTTDAVTDTAYGPIIDSQSPSNSFGVLTNHPDITTFSVTVDPSSAPPVTYQWYSVSPLNVTNAIANATTASYVTVDTNSQTLFCIVSNFLGTATSSPVSISIFARPTPSAYQSAVLSYKPVGYWLLNETNGNIAFDYAGTNDGVYTGNYQLGQPGLPATAGIGPNLSAYFDGTNAHVDIPGAGDLNITGPLTVMQWVRPPVGGDTGFPSSLGHSDQSYRLDVVPQPHFACPGGDVVDTASINDGNWHELAGVYDGTTQYLYVDQQLVGTRTASGTPNSTDDVFIGGAPDYGNRYFAGNIAQVAIFTNALTSNQLAVIYDSLDTPPSVTISPASPSIYAGSSITLTANLTGTPATKLQWYYIDNSAVSNNITGATNATYKIVNTPLSYGGYTYGIIAANAFGTNIASVVLSVQNGPPYLPPGGDIAPLYADAYVGAPVTYTVNAAGSLPIYYQWAVNGTNVSGATNSSFTMPAECGSNVIQVGFTNSQNVGSPVYSSMAVLEGEAYPVPVTFNTNGAGWQLNSGVALTVPTLANNVLELTDNGSGENSSAFYSIAQYVGSFEASFIYTAGGNAAADGTAFILQNSTSVSNALGGGGGELGFAGITNSVALEIDLYSAVGIAVGTEGNTYSTGGSLYGPTGNIYVDSGDPIKFQLNWANGELTVKLTDTTTGAIYNTNYTIGPLTAYLNGSDLAYIGFSGADGGATSSQTISNFVFTSVIAPITLEAMRSGSSVIISWPAADPNYVLETTSSLVTPWVAGPSPTEVGGLNEVTVPVAGSKQQFYRLVRVVCP